MIPTKLFAYGTLDPMHAPPAILPAVQRLRYVADATLRGLLYDFGRYPGLVRDSSARPIHGRLYELPDDDGVTLAQFDVYEGFDTGDADASLFRRVYCRPTLSTGRRTLAWVYVYNRPTGLRKPIDADRWTAAPSA